MTFRSGIGIMVETPRSLRKYSSARFEFLTPDFRGGVAMPNWETTAMPTCFTVRTLLFTDAYTNKGQKGGFGRMTGNRK